SGTIERCDPPNSFAATWEFGGQSSWIEVSLSERPDGRVRLELEHVAHVAEDLWAQFGPGAVGIGWDQALMGLARQLSGGGPMDPKKGAGGLGSDDGHQSAALSSELWCQASITAGPPPLRHRRPPSGPPPSTPAQSRRPHPDLPSPVPRVALRGAGLLGVGNEPRSLLVC